MTPIVSPKRKPNSFAWQRRSRGQSYHIGVANTWMCWHLWRSTIARGANTNYLGFFEVWGGTAWGQATQFWSYCIRVCVCGCCIIGKPKTITRNTYGEEISDKVIIGWLGWHRLVLSTTLLELLYSGCVGVGPVNYQTKALFGTHMANKLPKQIVIEGVGWRRLVASNRSNGNFTNGGDSAGSGGWC